MSDNEGLISSLAETIEGNDYLLTQILIYVPLRDIIIFKCVSKRWLSLISDPFFSRCHATVKQRVPSLLLDLALDTGSQENLSLILFIILLQNPDLRSSLTTQSCNGLMLLESEDAVFIYNPTTEDKKTLPS
ncbi:hypothetical protein Ahy_B01g056235 [Arachis hypogaea]|uniref:F-box domain-containing protein n=1 Tax=Arachis hypogaea TaxID=3818 RepID=A0A445AYD2_ARAHY|nr:hypothetical protein Ahy_B01g056235 [Arachis hypogaea]